MEEAQQAASTGSSDSPTIMDREAFATKYMRDMCHGRETADFQVYAWDIEVPEDPDEKVKSPKFKCGGHEWQISCSVVRWHRDLSQKSLSLFLSCNNDESMPDSWWVCAQSLLAISSPANPSASVQRRADHRFTPKHPETGFTRFAPINELCQPKDERPPVIEDGKTTITAFVRVLDDPTGVLWHEFEDYNSRDVTGIAPLKNPGFPCFFTSLLNSLFCIGVFRRAIFQIPTSDDGSAESLILALQRIFYGLHSSNQAVSTTELAQSLAPELLKAITLAPYDPSGFIRLLLETIDTRAQMAALPWVSHQFIGKAITRIACSGSNFELSHTEEFSHVQLEVKGMKNLHDSLQSYCAPHVVSELGPSSIRERTTFLSLPPILHLQLRRFNYNSGVVSKLNDRFEFPKEIDLAEFLDESVGKLQPHLYQLHAVLGHVKDDEDETYYAFARPDPHAQWLHFDDDYVTPSMESRVFENAYGGVGRHCINATIRAHSAFMLVYIRKSAIDTILLPVADDEVPLALQERFKEEEGLLTAAHHHVREAPELYVSVRVVTDQTITQHQGFDLAAFGESDWPPSDLPTFHVPKNELYSAFKGRIARHFGLEESRFRLWTLGGRQGLIIRPERVVPGDDPGLRIESFRPEFSALSDGIEMYLDVEEESSPFSTLDDNYVMVFTKFFDVWGQCIKGRRKFYVHKRDKVHSLALQISKAESWGLTSIQIYEEIGPGVVTLINQGLTFEASGIGNGDIICYQTELSKEELVDLESQGFHTTAAQFYDFVRDRVLITFKPLRGGTKTDQFDLAVKKWTTFEDLLQRVGRHLQCNPSRLCFESAFLNGTPHGVFFHTQTDTVSEMSEIDLEVSPVIFYEKAGIC